MIRNATIDDIASILQIGELMHKESIYAAYNYDTNKVANLMHWLMTTEHGICIVSEEDGVIQGGFAGYLDQHWFGTELVASDYALFLAPEYRSGSTAARLIKEYIKQANSKGAAQIMLANSTGVQIDGVARLYEAMGFEKRGYVFELTKHI